MKSIKVLLMIEFITFGFLAATHTTMASVASFMRTSDGVTFKLDKGMMNVKVCKDDIIEVKFTILPSIPSKTSLVIVNKWYSKPKFDVSQNTTEIIIKTPRLKIKVNRLTNSIKYTDLHDDTILSEDNINSKKMSPDTIAGISTYNCISEFASPANEALYGLGCHPEDSLAMNYKGRNQDLAIKYMTGAIPVLLSTKGYGLMWDNYSASNFYGAEDNNTKFKYVSESGTMVDYYFFYGPEFDQIIKLYRQTTGQAPMFPKWAFGLFQSQDRYQSQKEVLSVKDNYRNNKIPVDCIVQDWFYWEPNVIGSHIMYPLRYPDPKNMIDELHQANIHAMISIWPVFAKGTDNFDELNKAGCLTDILWDNVMTHTFDSYYDAHNPKARDIYWRQANNALITPYGWDAWWVDQCEPDNGALLDARRKSIFSIGKGIDYFNTYALMHSTGLYDHWRKDIPAKRAFFPYPAGIRGTTEKSATLWSSDITCTFKAFKIQVPQGINSCVSGIPYWTSDIGGYHYHWMPPDWSTPANRELFTRWFEFGTFCPIFRIHGKGERALFSNNWDDNTKKILLKYDNLRYRLMPYIYSLSWKVTNDSYTIMRALAFDFRTDAAINNISDQSVGPAILVNPVTQKSPVEETRRVYLPKSSDWFDFWTGKKLSGGFTITSPAPIETIPLFIKAGSIIPMGPYLQYAAEKPADPIELRIYPGADGTFTLYEDENDNYNYEKGNHSTIDFKWDEYKRELTIGQRQGKYPGMLKERTINIIIVGKNHGTDIEICQQPDKVIKYYGAKLEIKF